MNQIRSELRFCEEAQAALKFLAKDGFECIAASERQVRYESAKVYIEILHGFHDFEVHIVFGRMEKQERYSFELFLKSVNPALEKTLGDRMADTPETVAATVRAVSLALQSDGQEIIIGDDDVFECMKDVRWWQFCPEALE